MGRSSQALTLVLKILLRKEIPGPRKLTIPIIVLSILFILSFTNTALINLEQLVQEKTSDTGGTDTILEMNINGNNVIIVCGEITLYNVNSFTPITIRDSLNKLYLECYNISTKTVICPINCNSYNIASNQITKYNNLKITYSNRINILIENLVKSYNSIFNLLYYTILVLFVLSLGGISYGFAVNIERKWVKISYWISKLEAILAMSFILSLYIVIVSLSLGVISMYFVLLLLSFITSTPYIRPMLDMYSIVAAFAVSWVTVFIGLRMGAKTG